MGTAALALLVVGLVLPPLAPAQQGGQGSERRSCDRLEATDFEAIGERLSGCARGRLPAEAAGMVNGAGELLALRFARGEIDAEEYEERRKLLEGSR